MATINAQTAPRVHTLQIQPPIRALLARLAWLAGTRMLELPCALSVAQASTLTLKEMTVKIHANNAQLESIPTLKEPPQKISV
jgi:hypothetical protein